jgi:ketosteroid isomerase-like protein
VPHQAGARVAREQSIRSPEELVRLAYKAFARNEPDILRGFCHQSLEVRPVDELGLVGDTLRGFDAAWDWVHRRSGLTVSVWVRTLERVSRDRVLGVGVVSERGRGCAATVAWVWHFREGLIDSVCGYPNEAAARRALGEAA